MSGAGGATEKFVPGSSEARVRALLNRFEGRPEVQPEPAPKRDRVASALDAPRAVVDGAAAVERDLARARLDALNPNPQPSSTSVILPQVVRKVPSIGPRDSDRIVTIKREILAREAEIQSTAAKIVEISTKLDRIIGMLQVADMPVVRGDPDSGELAENVRSISLKSAAREASGDSNSSGEADGIRSGRPSSSPAATKSPTAVTGNTLADILAAARGSATGGAGASRAKSETPKYASMLKDLQ